jgi:biopolymer transport protein ExbD
MPDEQVIEIFADGRIVLNNTVYGKGSSRDLPDLVVTLSRFKAACDNARTKALITIFAEDDALHQRVIDAMNACAGARIKNITFGTGG